ncbi:unnamed protein product [Ambrosiozyma monospora]|uniref:Unnamed protein product n=1 Tax=Ambrosiozyma monospora TaxID=43982 RepID=A0ACB5SSC0_AMBMO|nr:unnamed protein product [Ambrosiozyma monospora]
MMSPNQKLTSEPNSVPNTNGSTRSFSNGSVTANKNGNVTSDDNEISSVKVVAKLTHDPNSPSNTAGLSELLSIALGMESRVGDLICLEAPFTKPNSSSKIFSSSSYHCKIHKFITVTPSEQDKVLKHDESKRVKEASVKKELSLKLKDELAKLGWSDGCPVTKNMKLPIIDELLPLGGTLEFSDSRHGWFMLRDGKFPGFEFGDDTLVAESFLQVNAKDGEDGDDDVVIGQDKLIAKIVRGVKRGNPILLYGASGSGKTVVVNEVVERLKSNLGYYVKLMDCEEISNDNVGTLKTLLENTVKEVNWHSPSLLILENIDSLIPQELEHGDSGMSRQIAEIISNKFDNLIKQRQVTILFTSKSKNSVNSVIFQKHLIETEFSLKAPNKDQRSQILNHLLTTVHKVKASDSELINEIVAETEGYSPSDLKTLVGRAYHDLISSTLLDDNETAAETITLSNFEKALANFVPSSLRGVKLQKSTTSWSEIGGLKEAKQVLLETLEWPTKYAPIFANCPLRLRSGILLYGYPGCGKTLLASAIASQCGLNFISIKGPEILNKYIGASEQSVRELFERASAAKPCILFFDEFDSIAPKRGHDSTGVTDRIVNQLLTQMDGAEGLDGVYVLAATSRPDLIDSALLRPGRLDKSIICDLPDFENRLDIIKTVIENKFSVDDGLDLKYLAEETDGYSGADLQALVYNSYLKAIHDNLEAARDDEVEEEDLKESKNDGDDDERVDFFMMSADERKARVQKPQYEKKIEAIYDNLNITKNSNDFSKTTAKASFESNEKPKIKMSMKHLEQGLEETKKSISNHELEKFKQIYSQFNDGKREGQLPNGEASQDVGGRVTLM